MRRVDQAFNQAKTKTPLQVWYRQRQLRALITNMVQAVNEYDGKRSGKTTKKGKGNLSRTSDLISRRQQNQHHLGLCLKSTKQTKLIKGF